jgi:hypothetical protein
MTDIIPKVHDMPIIEQRLLKSEQPYGHGMPVVLGKKVTKPYSIKTLHTGFRTWQWACKNKATLVTG